MYSTAEQVADEFQGIGIFTTTTEPKLATVERWIEEADQEINAKVGLRYIIPTSLVDIPNDALILRQISIMLVSARVRRRINRTGPTSDTSKVIVTETDAKARKMLDQIASGDLPLTELDPKSGDLGISSATVGCSDPFIFKKHIPQW